MARSTVKADAALAKLEAQVPGSPTPLLATVLFRPLTEAAELANALEFFLGSDHQTDAK